ncbi:type II toxin-antitoxin system RelE/ParE family toxin [Algoriphagus sp.]|uniref:type II toxin-antitoxin system RelE/ParE family toxin n=1 Tax=Algoriphagus sp. TaxID=1872435 RepID=UPI002724C2FE|nr:type II toxin-antitoxin system RelE/ParE family toxin [Algoriphagus sp.]MDO8965300.1 type II toxin-antitoxin system RelE/ParE family toxin [Algoriphagus sp.]MDP3198732.1 type II toxin-antitoxin system RelE/ParE family toxin [Algoriphagus sp.]
MVNIFWSDLAVQDLKTIHSYIKEGSKFYADQQVQKLIKRVDQLENFPESGRIVPEFSISQIRELTEGNYRIVYYLDLDSVFIMRVHHSALLLRFIKD